MKQWYLLIEGIEVLKKLSFIILIETKTLCNTRGPINTVSEDDAHGIQKRNTLNKMEQLKLITYSFG